MYNLANYYQCNHSGMEANGNLARRLFGSHRMLALVYR